MAIMIVIISSDRDRSMVIARSVSVAIEVNPIPSSGKEKDNCLILSIRNLHAASGLMGFWWMRARVRNGWPKKRKPTKVHYSHTPQKNQINFPI